MPPKKPSQSKPNQDLLPLLKSPAYEKLLKWLEVNHPVNSALTSSATMEHRAMHQIRCQVYQEILLSLRTLQIEANKQSIPITYEKENK